MDNSDSAATPMPTPIHRYGPRPAVFAVGGVLLAAAVVAALIAGGSLDRMVAVVVAVFVAATLIAALRLRSRLQASTAGLLVGTLSGPRQIRWSEVHRIEVVNRKRMGASSSTLELDLDDDELLVFGRMDLGTDPEQVAEDLRTLRTGRGR